MNNRIERNRTRRPRVIAIVALISAALLGCGEEPPGTDTSKAGLASAAVPTNPSAPSSWGAHVAHGFGPCGDCDEHGTLLMNDVRSDAHRWALTLSPDAWNPVKNSGGVAGYASSEATYLRMPQALGEAEDDAVFMPDHETAAIRLMRNLPAEAVDAGADRLRDAVQRAQAEIDLIDDSEDIWLGHLDGIVGNGGPVGAGPCADCMYVYVKPDDVVAGLEELHGVGKVELEFESVIDGQVIRITIASPPVDLVTDESGNDWLRFEIPLSAVEKLPISWLVRIGGELQVDTRDAEDQTISFETRPQPMDAQRRDAVHDPRIDRARLPRPVDPMPGDDF